MGRRFLFVVLVFVFIFGLLLNFTISGAINEDEWPMFRGNLQHTGYTSIRGPEKPQTIWRYKTGIGVRSSPAVYDGKIYIGSYDDYVYCLDAKTGGLIWRYKTGWDACSSPAVANEKVYIGSCDNYIYCLDAKTGKLVWKYKTGSYIDSSPAVANEKVYIGSGDNYIYCLDAETGKLVWRYKTGGGVDSSPAVANEKVYIGSWDGYVYCFKEASSSSKEESTNMLIPTLIPTHFIVVSIIITTLTATTLYAKRKIFKQPTKLSKITTKTLTKELDKLYQEGVIGPITYRKLKNKYKK